VKLHEILQSIKGSVIIFLDTKRGVDNLNDFLNRRNYNAISIHGDKSQDRRQAAIVSFSKGEVPILIATDVASRGLDFPNVPYVFNYDMPTNIDDYIHRIGRTGRCGNKGTAISFIQNDCRIIKDLMRILQKAKQQVPDWFEKMHKENQNAGYQGGNNNGGYKKSFNKFSNNQHHSSNSTGHFNNTRSNNYQSNNTHSSGHSANPHHSKFGMMSNNNYATVSADFFRKGENFVKPVQEPNMTKEYEKPSYNNFNNNSSTNSNSYANNNVNSNSSNNNNASNKSSWR